MKTARMVAPMVLAIALAIGCGGSKSQGASPNESAKHTDAPIQLTEAPAGAQPAAAANGSGSITGTVHLAGSAPAAQSVAMSADPVCQQQHTSPVMSEEVVANPQGGLKNVFVYIKDGVKGSFPAPPTPGTRNQNGCWYTPHVFGIQANQPLEIVNSDATLHNVNAKPTKNQPFNVAQPVKGMKTTKKFANPEVMVNFKCNVHPWMHAYAGVTDHPFFAVSGDDGSFTIQHLPAGTYTVEAWQEKYGTQTQTVTVKDGESQSVEFTFQAQ